MPEVLRCLASDAKAIDDGEAETSLCDSKPRLDAVLCKCDVHSPKSDSTVSILRCYIGDAEDFSSTSDGEGATIDGGEAEALLCDSKPRLDAIEDYTDSSLTWTYEGL